MQNVQNFDIHSKMCGIKDKKLEITRKLKENRKTRNGQKNDSQKTRIAGQPLYICLIRQNPIKNMDLVRRIKRNDRTAPPVASRGPYTGTVVVRSGELRHS